MTWLVLGAGASGLAAAALLRKQKQDVIISDQQSLSPEKKAYLQGLGVSIQDGATDLAHLERVDQGLVVSPGISEEHVYITAARKRQLPILSEIDLCLASYQGQVLAVTGTNGKSTTVAMIGYLLQQAGIAASVAGNIGTPPSLLLAEDRLENVAVLELSSYQLLGSRLLAPKVAVFTNFTPDHLSRHGTLANYFSAKWSLFRQQTSEDTAIIAVEAWDEAKKLGLPSPAAKVFLIDQTLADSILPNNSPETALKHNRLNGCAAVLAVSAFTGLSLNEVSPLLRGFKGLAHRCERLGHIKGRLAVNDSKATNVASTLTALESHEGPLVLMLGGQGKGESFAPIADYRHKIAKIIAFGAAGPEIVRELGSLCPLVCYDTLALALQSLMQEIKDFPDTLLFSPACASFDEFANFEERGHYFRQTIQALMD